MNELLANAREPRPTENYVEQVTEEPAETAQQPQPRPSAVGTAVTSNTQCIHSAENDQIVPSQVVQARSLEPEVLPCDVAQNGYHE